MAAKIHCSRLAIRGKEQCSGRRRRPAKVCFQHQRDFNYLEERHLWEDAHVDREGIRIAGMHYRALVVDQDPEAQAGPALETLERAGRVIRYDKAVKDTELIARIDELTPPDVRAVENVPGLRVRHVIKEGTHFFMLLNETHSPIEATIELPIPGTAEVYDPWTAVSSPLTDDRLFALAGHSLQVIVVGDV